jgi:Na+/proline symporter
MVLASLDVAILVAYCLVTLAVGLWASRRAGESSGQFFLSGRAMPWWLLGLSMVATTFSTDTPNLVTDITRTSGVAGNWTWWAFLLTGMLTTFVYARLWRRSGVLTDLEFYELRYSGRIAAFLRAFRALYLGVLFNVVVMATVSLAAIKIGGVLLGLSPVEAITAASVLTVLLATAGGLRAVLVTDCLLFVVAMSGSVAAAVFALAHPRVGGLAGLLAHSEVSQRLAVLPDLADPATFVPILLVPLAVQWWAAWYPGAEPGGGGYVAQRMLAARSEGHATGATLLFNVAHYALRPWPWILVALASIVVFPELDDLARAFPHVDPSVVRHDLAYPAMLTFLPAGWLGLAVGSLVAAYMSTVSTHLNWGASYVVHDFWGRFLRPSASERERVLVGRLTTVVLMLLAALLALRLENALQAFQILLQIGAGTGLLFLLRWFWWRINAWSELTAMVVSFAVAAGFFVQHRLAAPEVERLVAAGVDAGTAAARAGLLESWQELLVGVGATTVAWLAVTLLTPPAALERLVSFVGLVRPGGPGWRRVEHDAAQRGLRAPSEAKAWSVPAGIRCMLLGTASVYAALFATGFFLYGRTATASLLALVAAGSAVALGWSWRGLRAREQAEAGEPG